MNSANVSERAKPHGARQGGVTAASSAAFMEGITPPSAPQPAVDDAGDAKGGTRDKVRAPSWADIAEEEDEDAYSSSTLLSSAASEATSSTSRSRKNKKDRGPRKRRRRKKNSDKGTDKGPEHLGTEHKDKGKPAPLPPPSRSKAKWRKGTHSSERIKPRVSPHFNRLLLEDRLARRPPREALVDSFILRDTNWREDRRGKAQELSKRLEARPRLQDVKHMIHYPMATPTMFSKQQLIQRQHMALTLERQLRHRRSYQELLERQVVHDPEQEKRRKLQHLSFKKLYSQRPTLAELQQKQIFQDTMTWVELRLPVATPPIPSPSVLRAPFPALPSVPPPPSAVCGRNCHGAAAVTRGTDAAALYVIGGYGARPLSCGPVVLNLASSAWTAHTLPLAPPPRYAHTVCRRGTDLFVFGGYDGSAWLNDLWCLNTQFLHWRHYEDLTEKPSPRAAHSAVVLGNRMIIFGGNDGEQVYNDLWSLDFETLEWEEIHPRPSLQCDAVTSTAVAAASLPSQGAEGSSGSRNERARGEGASSSRMPRASQEGAAGDESKGREAEDVAGAICDSVGCSSDIALATPKGRKKAANAHLPRPRSGHTAVLHEESRHMIVFGGGSSFGGAVYNDLFLFDFDRRAWFRPYVEGAPPHPRMGHTAVLLRNRMLVFGGGNHRAALNDLHVLDLDAMRWSTPAVVGGCPAPRAGHTATVIGNTMVVFGGADPETQVYADLHVLDTEFSVAMAEQIGARDEEADDGYSHSNPTPYLPSPLVDDTAFQSTQAAIAHDSPLQQQETLFVPGRGASAGDDAAQRAFYTAHDSHKAWKHGPSAAAPFSVKSRPALQYSAAILARAVGLTRRTDEATTEGQRRQCGISDAAEGAPALMTRPSLPEPYAPHGFDVLSELIAARQCLSLSLHRMIGSGGTGVEAFTTDVQAVIDHLYSVELAMK